MTPPPAANAFSWRPFGAWVLAFAILCAPLILARDHSNLSDDEAEYYLPAIAQIRSHWPRLDLVRDSLSATSPGYPYVLATVSLVTGPSRVALRIVNWIVSAAVLALFWSLLRRHGAGLTLALAPLALSNFFVKSASFVVTDNAALLAIGLAVVALLFTADFSGVRRGALGAALAVAIRQTNAWLVLPLAIREAMDARREHRRARGWWLVLPLVPLGILALAWHGLVPPVWTERQVAEGGFSLTPLVYELAVLATLGWPFYLAVTTPAEGRALLRRRGFWLAAAAGLALSVLVSTVPDHAAGRWGGYWWSIAARLPVIGHTSPVFLVLAAAGGALAFALVDRLARTAGAVAALRWTATLAAWSATALVNHFVFHRYFEPPLLVFLIAWIALQSAGHATAGLARRWPLLALAAGQLGLTLVTTHAQAHGLTHFT